MIVHCTIFGKPEPSIKWFKDKIPLNLCSIPRYTIFNHPDDLHEHTIASIIVTSPSYLDNGDFIVEVQNEAGFERRVANVQFQTEEEYNAIYFQKYLEHKENLKYHVYRPGETRWEDIVPEVKEFVFWEPPEEEEDPKKKKKKRKKKRKVLKTIITPWGDEKQVEVTDEDDSGESVECSDEEGENPEEEEQEEEEDQGWNVPGEVVESEPEEEMPINLENEKPTVQCDEKPSTTDEVTAQTEEQILPTDEQALPAEEPIAPVVEVMKEPTPEKYSETNENSAENVASAEETAAENLADTDDTSFIEVPNEQSENLYESGGAYGEDKETQEIEEEYEPYKRKEAEVEHPIILRRPKFYITDFQLRKKFYFVSKLIDVELLKGKTLRLQSLSASIGPVTCEWHHNGRLVKSPTARKYIEFYTRKNMTVLEIENTRVQDSGTYTCTHYNDYTEPLIDSCKVIITVPQPKETADQPPTFTRLLTGINHYRLIKYYSNTE